MPKATKAQLTDFTTLRVLILLIGVVPGVRIWRSAEGPAKDQPQTLWPPKRFAEREPRGTGGLSGFVVMITRDSHRNRVPKFNGSGEVPISNAQRVANQMNIWTSVKSVAPLKYPGGM